MLKNRIEKKMRLLLLIVLSIVTINACVSPTKHKIGHTDKVVKDQLIYVIINDQTVKSGKSGQDGPKFVDKLEKVFERFFRNVSVRTGYDTPEFGELVITPNKIETSTDIEETMQMATTSKIPMRLKVRIESDIIISYNNIRQNYSIDGLGEYKTSVSEKFATYILGLSTLGLSGEIQKESYSDVAKNRALESTAINLHNEIISSSGFKAYAESTKMLKTLPSSLIAKIKYSDKSSIFPNSTIDAGEKSTITGTIINNGKGTAFDVNIITESSNKNIDFPETISVGDIQPGESKDITIPIKTDLSLVSGTALFLINVLEKRGYNSRPLELQIPTVKLQSPKLMFASCQLNDSSGLASGDGDNQPENNEIIEVNPYFKNEGVGDAINVTVLLATVSEGLEIIKSKDELVKLSPGSTKKSTLAFKIPRTYAESEIKYTIIATDVRGMRTEKSYTIPFDSKSPKLKFSYEIIGQNNEASPYLENGKSYLLMIVPENIGSNFAQGVRTSVQTTSKNALIGMFNNDVGIIDPDIKGRPITIPIDLRRSFSETSLALQIKMDQDSFPGIEKEIILPVQLKQPNLQYKVTSLNGVNDKNISRNTSSNFRIAINNQGDMDAEDVKVRFQSMKDGIEFDEEKNIGRIRSGDNQYVDFIFFVRGDVETGSFPVKLAILQADIETITSDLSYEIVEQPALIQKVKGTGQSMSGGDLKNAYAGPPQFYINTPYNNIKTINQQISLHGSIITFGTGNATQDLTITQNGRPLSIIPVQEEVQLDPNIITKREVEDNKVIFNGSIMLDPGKNVIQVNGIDRNGLKSSETIIVIKQSALGNIYAVVVGISEFFNQDYNLGYAAKDALKFNNFLKSKAGGSLSEDRIKFLYNHMANRANVIDALTNFLGQTSKEDIVEIYMATHGYVGMDGKLYYICHDTDVDNLKGTGFSDEDLTEILSQDIKAGKVIIYLDTCHAGLSGLSKLYAKRDIDVINVNKQVNKLADEISRTKNGVAKFSASSANGYSLEDPALKGGVFTHWLIKGLNGKANENNDEWVNAVELEKYLRKNVTMATKGKQTPKAIITLDDNTPLAKVR
ncbi:MAG: hypothetical protein HOJ48_13525 [Desulfobacula sp.]|nr:hypothetical protein [Deltaproteobacteria bacterium]MBT6340306.1 hypothetical protein [Desulfobacula sp.]